MPRFTVYLPQHLYDKARAELPDGLSWSSLLAGALSARLARDGQCAHQVSTCAGCGCRVEATAAEG